MKLFTSCLLAAVALAAPQDELMGQLPDAPAFPTNTYSGYLNVSDTKSLHYVFAESQSDPTTDPIIIWFNGGPGCSSMLAFMQEMGPIEIDDGETYLSANKNPWIRRANVIWLESPAGVGWSIAGTEADLSTNDMIQSEDALAALKSWYGKFPEYSTNPLYVSGESYAGIYVPYLAWQIYQNNLQADFKPDISSIPLAGIMVGNGATDWTYDVWPSFAATVANMNIIPFSLLDELEANNCVVYFHNVRPSTDTPECKRLGLKLNKLTEDLNWYDLYRQNYDLSPLNGEERFGTTVIGGEERRYKRGYTPKEYTPFATDLFGSDSKFGDVVLGDFVTFYMNKQETRDAFNIPDSVQVYEQCSSTLDYHVQDEASLWIYPILRNKYKLMFYSGDTDGAIPTYGTKQWI